MYQIFILFVIVVLSLSSVRNRIMGTFINKFKFSVMKFVVALKGGNKAEEAEVKGKEIYIPFLFKDKKYLIILPYNRRDSGFSYIGLNKNGEEENCNYLSNIPLYHKPRKYEIIYKEDGEGNREELIFE